MGDSMRSRGNSRRAGHARPSSRERFTGRRTITRTRADGQSSQGAAEKQLSDALYQAAVKNFYAAVRFIQKQNFEKAKEILEKLVSSPVRDVAARAQVHLRLCEQKLSRTAPALKTADDYYYVGVAELNARNLDAALEHLSKADKMTPNQEHIRYALAVAHALQGNSDAALEHLKAAVDLRPSNCYKAKLDQDFEALASDPRFVRLVSSDASETP